MDYGRGIISSIEFKANIYLNKKDEVTFSLTNNKNEPLGILINFTHNFLRKHASAIFFKAQEISKRICNRGRRTHTILEKCFGR